jgi:ADP-heptose:LPS heptosyltransferase
MERPPGAERILVVRLGAIGDVVRTLPAAALVREAYPAAHLAWLVEPATASLLRAQPWLDEVLVFPRTGLRKSVKSRHFGRAFRELRGFLQDLRSPRFDLVVDFHSILKSGLLSFASGAHRRVAYARPFGREAAWLFATDRARLEPSRMSRFDRNVGLVHFLGIDGPSDARPLFVDPTASEAALTALGVSTAPVVIHPGTSDTTAHKRYSAEGFAAVARALAEDPGIPSIVTAGPAESDRAAAEAVVSAAPGAARLAPRTPELPELAGLFSRCQLFIGNDTGPMHVASLVGTPVVQILGPTDPVENAPFPGTPSRTVRIPVACSPCRRGCAAATCLRVVPPDAVVAAARELLAAGQRRW